MHDHPSRQFPAARVLAAAAALATATVITACSAAAPANSSAPTTSATNPSSSTLAFSKCMRANGVPNFPDSSSNGMRIEGDRQTVSVNGVSVNAPAFRAARQTCEKYMPHSQVTPAQSAQQRQRGLQFARCMRSHGVPNFPDPKTITGPGGNQEAYLPGVDPQSPAFQDGAKACGGGPKGP
jgi:hypothetical protein